MVVCVASGKSSQLKWLDPDLLANTTEKESNFQR